MKPLVFASYAQFGVDAEDEEYWAIHNGIWKYDPLSVETSSCGNLRNCAHSQNYRASRIADELKELTPEAQDRILQMLELMIQQEKNNNK